MATASPTCAKWWLPDGHVVQRRQPARSVLRSGRLALSDRWTPRLRHPHQGRPRIQGPGFAHLARASGRHGLEWLAGGGFDNPVELIFTPAGETIGTMTYFRIRRTASATRCCISSKAACIRSGTPVVSEFKRTGDLMPVMTKFARIAPAGLARYRGAAFGAEYQGNLFSAQFNPHRVQRHVVHREGATFRTEDSDFLTSRDPDFHPTDVSRTPTAACWCWTPARGSFTAARSRASPSPRSRAPFTAFAAPGAARVCGPARRTHRFRGDAAARRRKVARRSRARRCGIARSSAWWRTGEPPLPALASVRKTAPSYETRAAAVFALFRIGTAARAGRSACGSRRHRFPGAARRGALRRHGRGPRRRRTADGDGAAGPSRRPAAGDCRARADRRSAGRRRPCSRPPRTPRTGLSSTR